MPGKKHMKLLVIGGGGIYGMVPASFLSCLTYHDMAKVDVFGGTSVGGILAMHLAVTGDPSSLAEDFRRCSGKFFSGSLLTRLNPFSAKYPEDGVESELKRMIPGAAGDCPRKFVALSFSMKSMEPVVFQNFDGTYSHIPMWKMARATSAAPTYFPPFSENILIDGGILENVPVMTAAATARIHTGRPYEEMDVLAIGTGRRPQNNGRKASAVRKYTRLNWLSALLPVLTTGGNTMMSELWGEAAGFASFRMFNPVYIDGIMDNVSEVDKIAEKCSLYMGEFRKAWDEFVG